MIWHEIVCDECSNVLTGFSGLKNYNARLKKIAKKSGWKVYQDGTAYCGECAKKILEEKNERTT